MPVFDFVCTNPDCAKVTEKIVRSHTVSTIDCECGSPANKPELGWVDGSTRHVGVFFNYIGSDY